MSGEINKKKKFARGKGKKAEIDSGNGYPHIAGRGRQDDPEF